MAASGIKGGYWPMWTADSFPPIKIPDYFSHNFYAFIQINPENFELSFVDHQDLMRDFTSTLRSRNTSQKALLSIGGASGSSELYSSMASNPINRAAFIMSTIHVARSYNFDGLNLDWEYPKGHEDMTNLSALFREWHRAIQKESSDSGRPRLLLSAAVYYRPVIPYDAPLRRYPIDAIKDCLDFICVMCYNYYGNWNKHTGAHASLYDFDGREWGPSTDKGISSWIEAGVPPEKLVMGLPLFGRSWKLESSNVNGIGAPAVGVGPGEQDGSIIYNDIQKFIREKRATMMYDDNTVSAYSIAGTNWIGYDNKNSIEEKVRYAKGKGIGGFFFWALGYDGSWSLPKTAIRAWEK